MTRIIALLTCAAAAAPSAMLAAASAGSLRGPQGGEEATTVTRHRPSASDTVLAPAEGEEGYQHSIEDNLVQETTPELVSAKDLEAAVEMNSVDYDQGDFPYDGTTFTGDGTYYGETSNGNCAIRSPIPSIYDGMIPVALNNAQYGDSEMCGACIEGEGSGNGAGANPISGSFKAYVMDKCPECAYGDLDFSKSGDGRWDISWKFVPCSGGSDKPSFIFEGSHEYYWKIQPRGTKTPVEELKVAGASGTKTDDNFFEIWGAPYPLYGPQTVETKTMFGVTATQEVSL